MRVNVQDYWNDSRRFGNDDLQFLHGMIDKDEDITLRLNLTGLIEVL